MGLKTLLARCPLLPESALRAAYARAAEAGDNSQLADLASRHDLPADILAILAGNHDPKVAAALKARPARPDLPATHVPETRATVLARALGSRSATPSAEAFADAVSAFMATHSQVLLAALWHRPAAWFTPQQAAALLKRLDASPNLFDRELLPHDLVARLGPQLRDELLPRLVNPLLAKILCSFGENGPNRWDLTPASPPSASAGFESATEETIESASASRDPRVLKEVVAHLQTPARPKVPIGALTTLLRNRALDHDDRLALVRAVAGMRALEKQAAGRIDVVTLYADEPDTVAAWCDAVPEYVLPRHGWVPFGGAVNAPRLLTGWIERRSAVAIVAAAMGTALSDDDLRRMPAPVIAYVQVALNNDPTIDRIAALAAEALGDNPRAWDVYDALEGDYPGTFEELLQATTHMLA